MRHIFVNLPGMYTLAKKLGDLHDRDPTGVLTRGLPAGADSAVAETGRGAGYDRIEANGGPGMPLKTYLPKQDDLSAELEDAKAKLSPSLTPSTESAAVAASPERDRKAGSIKLREKRLDSDIWRCDGEHQRGAHFPISVFTNNVGRRSPKKLEERKQRQMQRPWFVPRWSQGSQERPPLRARPQQGS